MEKGAVDARIITTDKIVVEDRVVLKCKVGCPPLWENIDVPAVYAYR